MHDVSENILTDVPPASLGHWSLPIPTDKQWVNAGEFLGFSGKIVYRQERGFVKRRKFKYIFSKVTRLINLYLIWVLLMPLFWENATTLNTLDTDQHFTTLAIPAPWIKLGQR